MLLGRLGRTVGLVVGVSRSEGRMVLQVAVHPENRGEGSEVDVKPPRVEDLWHQAAVR